VRALGLVATLVGAAFLLGGCQYLLGLTGAAPPITDPGFGSFDPGDFVSFDPGDIGSFDPLPEDSLPPPLATYTKGSATITIAGVVTKLDTLTEPGVLYEDLGAETSWNDGNGLYVQFYSADPSDPTAQGGYIQLDRIRDGRHWAIADPTACAVTVKQVDPKGLSGTASCKDLQWTDTMSGFNGIGPGVVTGEPPFDAEISFRATP